MAKIPYASAIESFMYALLCTWLDIAYAISVTSKFQSNLSMEQQGAVKTILKYLKIFKNLVLTYGGGALIVKDFTNYKFQSDVNNKKSISSFMFTCNRGVVNWKSSKKTTITDSIIKAEYVATSDATKEVVQTKKFIVELGVVLDTESSIPLFYNNNGAIAQAKKPKSHQKSKNIERHFHIIRKIVGRSNVDMQKVASADNVVDPLTEAMNKQQLDGQLQRMGLR